MCSNDNLDLTLKEVKKTYAKRKRTRRVKQHEGEGVSSHAIEQRKKKAKWHKRKKYEVEREKT